MALSPTDDHYMKVFVITMETGYRNDDLSEKRFHIFIVMSCRKVANCTYDNKGVKTIA